MQVTVYKCDRCKKEIGPKVHISLSFGSASGISIPPRTIGFEEMYWSVKERLQGKFMHFCSVKCLASFFEDLIVKATAKTGVLTNLKQIRSIRKQIKK